LYLTTSDGSKRVGITTEPQFGN